MQVQLGIIGFGGIAKWHLNRIRESVPEINIKGTYDIREEACERALSEGLIVYESNEALLSDPEIDLVIIAIPNNFHKEYTIKALRAGKNVICEKPVAMNAQELVEMMAVADETGMLFTIHQNRRWDNDYMIVRKVIEDNILGELFSIESRAEGSRRVMHGWRGHKENGGGMVLDWGAHLLDQLMDMIKSPVISVDASLQSLFSDEIDDNDKIFIKFENGVAAAIDLSTNNFVKEPRFHVRCKDGTMIVNYGNEEEGRMVRLKDDAELEWADDIVYTAAGPTRTLSPRPPYTVEEMPLPEVHADWNDYYRNVVAAIEGKEELIVKPEQVLRVMKVIDLIFESSRLRKGLACNI